MNKEDEIVKLLEKKGCKVSSSASGKIVAKFDRSTSSQKLWDYLTYHPSFRVVFNALIKTGKIDLYSALQKLPPLLKESKTSFVYHAYCRNGNCRNVLNSPHILDNNGGGIRNISLTCPKCKTKNQIKKSDYQTVFKPDKASLIRVLLKGCELDVFSQTQILNCYHCDEFKSPSPDGIKNTDCPTCGHMRYLDSEFAPFDDNLNIIMGDKQGYWLEWYVWRLLRDSNSNTEQGLKLSLNGEKIEIDIACLDDGKLTFIECKDCIDDGFIKHLLKLSKIVDRYILVSSQPFRKDVLSTAKELMKNKFTYVPSSKIEELPKLI